MPPSETTAQSHIPLSFSLSPPIRSRPVPQPVPNNSCPSTVPESVFGWPALCSAVQSVLASLPIFRRLTISGKSQNIEDRNPPGSRRSPVPMSLNHRVVEHSHSAAVVMGSQPSTDISMLPVSPVTDDATNNAPGTVSALSMYNISNTNSKPTTSRTLAFTSLPDELIAMCYADLTAVDLVALEHVSRRLRHLIAYDSVCWKRCTESRWGQSSANSAILPAAARHAGTWKRLYSEKAKTDTDHTPWLTLCKSETLAILDIIKGDITTTSPPVYWPMVTDDPVPSSPPKDSVVPMTTSSPVSVMTGSPAVSCLSVVLLIDASSSVTDDDFDTMKRFSRSLVDNLRISHPEACVGVVQFNQHPKVEVTLTNVCKSKLSSSIDNMEQLMGSTDIAAPIRRARQILAEEEVRPGDRAIVLLTDGQTHADELQESEREARKAYEEVGARLYTLGVGRDIDEVGLGRVAAGSEGGMYFTLRRLVPSK